MPNLGPDTARGDVSASAEHAAQARDPDRGWIRQLGDYATREPRHPGSVNWLMEPS